MSRYIPTVTAFAVFLTTSAAAPALAADGPPPLVAAPPVEGPGALELAIDLALPTAAALAGWSLAAPLMPGASDGGGAVNAVYAIGATAIGLAAPGAALTFMRTRPFAWDTFLVSMTGGAVGIAAGFLGTRLVAGGKADPLVLALALGVGEGLGTAGAYHLYRANKRNLRDLDRLPDKRTDDPIEDWQLWKEKRNP